MKQRESPLKALATVDDLRDLAVADGPFLSVHLSFRPPSHDMAERTAVVWRAAREDAAAAGAPPEALAAVDEVVEANPHRLGAGLSVVATPGGQRHVEHLAVPPQTELVRWEPTPALTPLMAARQLALPVIVVLADRTGGDLIVRFAGAPPATATGTARGDEEIEVEGATHPLKKIAGGGWSHRRIQQRAEETWRHNMTDLADELTVLADRIAPVIVAIGGDERAATLLRDALPDRIRDRVRSIEVTRATDGSAEGLDGEIEALLRAHADDELARTVDVYQRELGQHDRATAGPADTLAELRTARVAVLLTPLGIHDARRAFIAAGGQQVAVTPETLPDPAAARHGPLVDIAVTAALATHADVRIVSDQATPPGGIGALLRW